MNQEQKLNHIDNVEKEMTNLCFKQCFAAKGNMKLDMNCVQTCYDKYLYSINHIMHFLIDEGRRRQSEYIIEAYGREDKDPLLEEALPFGGQDSFL